MFKDKNTIINFIDLCKLLMNKGIILAGGLGSRLFPITKAISKQLIPIYDKPMIYYPLTTLMLSGIREILIIINPQHKVLFEILLGNGNQWGIDIRYVTQQKPKGIAEALILAEDFLNESNCTLILGDNLFYGDKLTEKIRDKSNKFKGAKLFGHFVNDPKRYGVIEFNDKKLPIDIKEKPNYTNSNIAVTGMYFYDSTAASRAKELIPSERGELEITDLNKSYLRDNQLKVQILGRGSAWFDTGTIASFQDASLFVSTIQKRQGLIIGSPEEVAWRMGWINENQLIRLIEKLNKSEYGSYLSNIIKNQ